MDRQYEHILCKAKRTTLIVLNTIYLIQTKGSGIVNIRPLDLTIRTVITILDMLGYDFLELNVNCESLGRLSFVPGASFKRFVLDAQKVLLCTK